MPRALLLVMAMLIASATTIRAQGGGQPTGPGGGGVGTLALPCGEDCGGGDQVPPEINLLYPLQDVYASTDSIRIDWCDNDVLNATSRYVKVNGVTRTTSYVTALLQDCLGQHRTSTATAVPLNLGSNTVEAHICDMSGNCSTQSYTVTRRAGPVPSVSLAPYNANIQDYSRCAASCFTATYSYGTVPYYSLDSPRNVTLVYNGDRAEPRPFVHVNVTHGGTSGNLPNYFYLKLQRVGGNSIQFLNGEYELRFAPSAGAALRMGGQFSAAGNGMTSDSVYRLNVIVGAYYNGSVEETVVGTTVIVLHNHAARGVARGWGIGGIQRLIKVADSALIVEGDGSALYFRRSGASSFATPTGNFTRLTRVITGSDTTYVRAYVDSTKVTFNAQGRMTVIADAFGNATTFEYYGSGTLFKITYPLGDWHALYYNSNGLDRILDNTYTYATVLSDGRLTSFLAPDSLRTNFVYDASLRLSRIVSRLGDTVSTLGYHALSNRVLADSGPPIPVHSGDTARPVVALAPWQHAGVPYVATATNYFTPPRADTVRATITDAGGHGTRFTVNSFGQPLAASGVLNDTIAITYSTAGQPILVAPNLGVASSITYNTSGLPTSVTTGGIVRSFSYMAYGLVRRDSGVAGPVLRDTLIFATRTRRSSVADRPESVVRLDRYGRDSTLTDPSGHLVVQRSFGGWPWGNVVRDSSPGGSIRIYGYDGHGRPAWDSVPGYRRRNIRTYDPMGRVIAVQDTAGAAPTTYGYDGLHLRETVDPLGNRDSTYYNALGWPVVRVDAVGRRDSIRYDAEGLVRWTRSRDSARVDTVSYLYDAGHRLRSRRGPYIVADSFSYSADGLVASAVNSNSRVTTYTSGIRRQVDSVVTWLRLNGIDSTKYVHRYVYRSSGVTTSLLDSAYVQAPASVFRSHRFGYHATRFTTDSIWFGGALTRVPHDSDLRATGVILPGGETVTRAFLPSHASAFDSSSVLWERYSVGGGRLLAQTGRGFRGNLWTYDNLSHLATSHFGRLSCTANAEIGHDCVPTEGYRDSLHVYTSDILGNRLTSLSYLYPTHTAGYTTLLWSDTATFGPMNRLLASGGCSYVYAATGDVVRRVCGTDTTRYYWNGDGQLISFKRSGGDSVAFAYDPLGRVVRRSVNGAVASSFLWEGDNLQAQLSNTGAVVGEYSYYEVDKLHAFITNTQGSTIFYAHEDQAGNVRGLSDGVAPYPWVLSGCVYDDFGRTVTTYPTCGPQLAQWKGALNLAPEAGLYYMRNRWYDTRTGRFMSEDPAGLAGGLNHYAFAGGDPVNGSDPTGLYSCHITGFDGQGRPTAISCTYNQQDCAQAMIGNLYAGGGGVACATWVFSDYCRQLGGTAVGFNCQVTYPWRSGDDGYRTGGAGGGGTRTARGIINRVDDIGDAAVRACQAQIGLLAGTVLLEYTGFNSLRSGARLVSRAVFNQGLALRVLPAAAAAGAGGQVRRAVVTAGGRVLLGPTGQLTEWGYTGAGNALTGSDHSDPVVALGYLPVPGAGLLSTGTQTVRACFFPGQ